MLVASGGMSQKLSRTEFEEKVYHLIASTFQNYRDWYVIEERRKYNPKASEYVYEQNRGNKPHVVEVYCNGEFVCDVKSDTSPEQAKSIINSAFQDLIMKQHTQKVKVDWSEKDKDEKKEILTGVEAKMPKTCSIAGCNAKPSYREKKGSLCLKHYQEFAKKGKL